MARSRTARRRQNLAITTRPGTFSHGRLDQGTKALLERAPLAPGQRVLDIGCGCGGVGLYAARRVLADGHCVLVDSSCRATALAASNQRANAIANASVIASATHDPLPADHFDLVLANPPYFANFRIAKLFALTARRVLKVGGRLVMVAKERMRHAEIVQSMFGNCDVAEHRGYGILIATRAR
ncbi:MAG: methyltransferase [Planctomycetota bacterium]